LITTPSAACATSSGHPHSSRTRSSARRNDFSSSAGYR
jgi:hypothetical protein